MWVANLGDGSDSMWTFKSSIERSEHGIGMDKYITHPTSMSVSSWRSTFRARSLWYSHEHTITFLVCSNTYPLRTSRLVWF